MWDKIERALRIMRIVATLTILVICIRWQDKVPGIVESAVSKQVAPVIANFNETVTAMNGAINNANGLVTSVSKDYYDPADPESGFYWDIKASVETSAQTAMKTDAIIEDLRAGLMGGKDTTGRVREGLFDSANNLLDAVRFTVTDANKDLAKIFDDDKGLLKPLKGSLDNIQQLTLDLDREIKAGGNLDKTFGELALAVGDFDKLLKNEDIIKILAESAKTSHSLAEGAKSVEIALEPWRKKANQLKMILGKVAGMLKFVIPL